MKTGIRYVLTMLVLFGVSPLCGENPVDGDSSSTVSKLAIYDRYITANGGLDKLRNLNSMRIECDRVLSDGSSGSFIYMNRFPRYERSLWKGPRLYELRRGYDGTTLWSYSCTYEGKGSLDLNAQRQMPLFDWTLFDPAKCGAVVSEQPDETAGGKRFSRVQAVFDGGKWTRDYWFEADTMRLARFVDTESTGGKRYFVIDRSSKVDGIWFPQVMSEVDEKGSLIERVTVKDVQTNIVLLPEFAEPPAYPYGVEPQPR